MTKTTDSSPGVAIVPAPPRALIAREALQEAGEQRKLLGEYIREHMVEGPDYGTIPGAGDTKVLKKPGAEKLVDIYRCAAEYERTASIENWEKGFFHYEFKAKVRHRESGVVFAEGVGSANSMEAKYRWRQGSRKCPACGKETIIKGKAEYGGGWLCFAKKGGCGEKWPAGDQSIEGQEVGRIENDDPYTSVNTLLKMAKKRALVDAAVSLARVSDLFTQDLDDDADHPPTPPASMEPPKPTTTAKRTEKPPERPATSAAPTSREMAMPAPVSAAHGAIRQLLVDKGINQARWSSIIEGSTGKKRAGQLNEDDVGHVQAALVATATMPTVIDVAPGETEADATARQKSNAAPTREK